MKRENWKPIPGCPGYEVSDQGQVKSLKRKTPRILKPGHVNGYQFVDLSINGKSNVIRVAYLVLLAFVGPRPDGLVVCHENGIKDDDRLENLRYDTQKANMKDAIKNNDGVVPQSSLTKEQVLQAQKLLEQKTISEVAQELGKNRGIIASISAGRAYKHLTGDAKIRTKATRKRAREVVRLYATGDYTQQELADKFGLSISGVCRIINHQRSSDKEAIYPDRDNKKRNRLGKRGGRVKRDNKVPATFNDVERQALGNIAKQQASTLQEAIRFVIRDYAQNNNLWPMDFCPECNLAQVEILNDVNRRCESCGLHFSVEESMVKDD